MSTITRVILVAVLLGSGCAKPDWIQQTLVTVDVTGMWRDTDGTVELKLEQYGPKVTGAMLWRGLQCGTGSQERSRGYRGWRCIPIQADERHRSTCRGRDDGEWRRDERERAHGFRSERCAHCFTAHRCLPSPAFAVALWGLTKRATCDRGSSLGVMTPPSPEAQEWHHIIRTSVRECPLVLEHHSPYLVPRRGNPAHGGNPHAHSGNVSWPRSCLPSLPARQLQPSASTAAAGT
jgi:hypothetical protein